jgi:hypothetical protein
MKNKAVDKSAALFIYRDCSFKKSLDSPQSLSYITLLVTTTNQGVNHAAFFNSAIFFS